MTQRSKYNAPPYWRICYYTTCMLNHCRTQGKIDPIEMNPSGCSCIGSWRICVSLLCPLPWSEEATKKREHKKHWNEVDKLVRYKGKRLKKKRKKDCAKNLLLLLFFGSCDVTTFFLVTEANTMSEYTSTQRTDLVE
jgi:hypothetical protein